MAYDRSNKTSREVLPNWDRNADAYAFAPGGDAMPLLVELDPTDMPQIVNAEVWRVSVEPS